MALADIHFRFTWQAWHLVTSTFVLRGRRGTWRCPPLFHVADVALGDIHLRFAWQAWHLGHWAGSGGALGLDWSPATPRHFAWQAWHLVTYTFHVAGLARGDIHLRFAWQAWHLGHWAGSGGAWTGLVAGDAAALCVAGVALADIHFRFTWQVWHLVTSTFVLRGRRGTLGTGLALVARLDWIGDTHLRFTWQTWHLVTSTFVSRGKRGT